MVAIANVADGSLPMTETKGLVVENCTKAGSSQDGDYVRLTLTLKGGQQVTLFFPFKFYSGLMTALFAAGVNAYADQLKKFGNDANLVQMVGTVIFEPTDYELARTQNQGGVDLVVARFKKDRLPLVDVGFDVPAAKLLAEDLLAEIAKGPARPPTAQ
jgi:hypothetical protein